MTARGTVALLAILGALLAYLWLFEVGVPRTAAAPTDTEPLLAVPSAAIARVEVAEPGGRLTAIRSGAGWTDDRGRPWRDDAVSDLVDTLRSLRPVMVVDPHPATPADYGFADDVRRLDVADGGGRRVLALEIGERNPAWTALYVRRAGRPEVLLVGGVLGWELQKVHDAAPAR